MAQLARRQIRDLGIRLALGARAATVQWLVVRQGLSFVVVGVVLGMATAVVATRAMQEMLFEIRPTDPPTYLAATITLGLAAIVATWLPARRASRSDPARVLRRD
jgi:putative ABC transport system permease protein